MKKLSAEPLVTVVINTVDRLDDLKRCLEAVFKQSYRRFEVVVVNNGTGAETQRYLRELVARSLVSEKGKYPPLKVIEDQTKKLSYLFNVGWKNASPNAEILAYAADDTEPDPDWLKNIVTYLQEHTEAGAVSGPTLSTTQPPGEMFALYDLAKKSLFGRFFLRLYEYFVMEDRTFAPGYWPQSGAFTMGAGIPQPKIDSPIEIDLLTSGNMGITREAMESVGGFDENFFFNHADGDLFIRLKKAGWRLIFHPQVKVLHHMRFGPTRYPQIMGRDTAFYYLKDVRPHSLRGWLGVVMNLSVFLSYWFFKAYQISDARQLQGITGFCQGIFDFLAQPTRERNELVKTLAVTGGFLLLFAQAFRKVTLAGMLAYGDCTPFPASVFQAWTVFFSVWDYRSPGIYMPQIPLLSTLTFFEGLLIALLGGRAVLAQAFFHYLPLPLSFLSLYFVLSKFSFSRPAKFFAAFLYSANLVTVGEMTGGFEGSLYVQAIFPLLLWLLYDFYQQNSFRLRIILKFSVLLSLAYLLSDHVFLFLLPFALLFTVGMAVKRRFLPWLLFWLLSAFFVVLLTFFHTFYYAQIALPFLAEKMHPELFTFLWGNVRDTYNHLALGNALRLGASYYQNLFGTNFWWERLGFLLPLVSLTWLVFPANWKRRRFLAGFFLSFLVFLTLYFLISARETLFDLFAKLPFLFRFRNPSRPWLFLSLLYALLSALTIDGARQFVGKFSGKIGGFLRGLFWVGVSLLFLGVGTYFWPFFSGDFTLSQHPGSGRFLPERYYQVGEWLTNQRRGDDLYRVLWLPWTHEETEVKLYWLDPYAYAVPINYGAYEPNAVYLDHMKGVYQSLAGEKLENVGEALAQAGVKYVILNRESREVGKAFYRYDYLTPWLLGSYTDWERILNATPDLRSINEIVDFKIYQSLAYSSSKVDLAKAGFPPVDLVLRQRTRFVVIAVSFLAWLAVSLALWQTKQRIKGK